MANKRQRAITAEDQFGRRLRLEREKRGWTQADVAARLGESGVSLHPTAIAKMEQRETTRPRVIRLNEAEAVADLFGLSVSAMLNTESLFKRAAEEATVWGHLIETLEKAADQFLGTIRQIGAENLAQSDAPEAQRNRNHVIRGLMTVVGSRAAAYARFQLAADLLDEITDGPTPDAGGEEQHVVMRPTSYYDARWIGEAVREGHPVTVETDDMKPADARRLVDFSAGLIFGLRGTITRLARQRFLLTSGDRPSAEEPVVHAPELDAADLPQGPEDADSPSTEGG